MATKAILKDKRSASKVVLDTIACSPKPVSRESLYKHFGITRDVPAQSELESIIQSLIEKKQVLTNGDEKLTARDGKNISRFMVVRVKDEGRQGYVELEPIKWGQSVTPPKLYLTDKKRRKHDLEVGQKVLVRLESRMDGRFDDEHTSIACEVMQALEPEKRAVLIGKIQKEGKQTFFIPDRPSMHRSGEKFLVKKFNTTAHDGERVIVSIREKEAQAKATLVDVESLHWDKHQSDKALGRHVLTANGHELHHDSSVERPAQQFLAPFRKMFQKEFPTGSPSVNRGLVKEVEKMRREFFPDHEDMTDIPIQVIDGDDAKDHDDGVYAEEYGDGEYRAYIAIADMASLVLVGSQWDLEARRRLFSTYAYGHTSHLYPDMFAQQYASLAENKIRPALFAVLRWGKDGEIRYEPEYKLGLMRAHSNLTYARVDRALLDPLSTGYDPFDEQLQAQMMMIREAELARKSYHHNELNELEFFDHKIAPLFDENGMISGWMSEAQSESRNMIKTFMNTMNIAAGRFLQDTPHNYIARVQYPTDEDMLVRMAQRLKPFGLHLPRDGSGYVKDPEFWSIADVQDLLVQSRMRPPIERTAIESVILSALKPAEYELRGRTHMAMGVEDDSVVQITSPIRRYMDLIAMRAVVKEMGGPIDELWLGESKESGLELAHQGTLAHRESKATQVEALNAFAIRDIGKKVKKRQQAFVQDIQGSQAFITVGDCPVPMAIPNNAAYGLQRGDVVDIKVSSSNALDGTMAVLVEHELEKPNKTSPKSGKYEKRGRELLSKDQSSVPSKLVSVKVVSASAKDGVVIEVDMPNKKGPKQHHISPNFLTKHSPKDLKDGRSGVYLHPAKHNKSRKTVGMELVEGEEATLAMKFTKMGGTVVSAEVPRQRRPWRKPIDKRDRIEEEEKNLASQEALDALADYYSGKDQPSPE